MRFFSLDVLYAPRLPDLYFWWKSCVLYSRFYGSFFCFHVQCAVISCGSLFEIQNFSTVWIAVIIW